MIKVAHLLDDFSLGGVTQALKLFEDPRITRHSSSQTVGISPKAKIAPHLDAQLIVIHFPPTWGRIPFLVSLRMFHPQARIIQVEHSYTKQFEALHVRSKYRFRNLLKIAAGLVDEVVAVSDGQKNWLAEIGLPTTKLRKIHPYCDRKTLFDVPDLKQHQGPVRLLAYGRLAEEKNYPSLIKAMLNFSPAEAKLSIFGSGPQRQELEILASNIGNVQLYGECRDPKPWLDGCDAVVVPSVREAFGLVATEARMAGRPILVADVDGLPEQALGNAGMTMPLRNPEEITRGIRRLIQSDLVTMGKAARKSVIDQNEAVLAAWLDELRLASRVLQTDG